MDIKQINVHGQNFDIKDAFARATIASEFNSENEYVSGDFCLYSNKLYKCLSNTTGSWDSSAWKQTYIGNEIVGNDDIDKLIERTIVSYEGNNSSIGEYAFYRCTSLQSINSPYCTKIHDSAFQSCSSLQLVSFPACISIGESAFYKCTSLQSVNFPACTFINYNAFQFCTSLQTVSFPACISIALYVFAGCTSLQSVSFPVCISIGNNAFQSCTSLQLVSFPNCTTIDTYAFRSCRSLSAIYLLASSICTLSNSQAFYSTPMQYSSYLGYFGSIYVPSSLVAAYKTATNWTYYADRITSYIEE